MMDFLISHRCKKINLKKKKKKKKKPSHCFLEKEDKSKESRNGLSNRRRCRHSDRNGRL